MKYTILEKQIANKKDKNGIDRDYARFKVEIDKSFLFFKNKYVINFDFYKIINWFSINGELIRIKLGFYEYQQIKKTCEEILYQDFDLDDIFKD